MKNFLEINLQDITFEPWSWKISGPEPWIFPSEQYKLIFTEIPKAGSTNWKKVLMVLNGLVDTTVDIPEVRKKILV